MRPPTTALVVTSWKLAGHLSVASACSTSSACLLTTGRFEPPARADSIHIASPLEDFPLA